MLININKISKNEQNVQNKLITLIGMMGTGKTKFGCLVAKKLNCNFYDSDIIIEKKFKTSIKNLFKTDGENFFRKVEKEEIYNLINKTKIVKDHVIGVTLAGQTIANELDRRVKGDYSKLDRVQKHINSMCKDWLQHHLWLWTTCRLTYDEHSPKRLKRASQIDPGSESMLDFKKNLKHYEQAGISVEEYK